MSDPIDEPEGRAAGGRARAEKLPPERKQEIARMGAAARWQNSRASKFNDSSITQSSLVPNLHTPEQLSLSVQVQCQKEIDGIGMGVLSDGTAFLTGLGLARLCDVDSSKISELALTWDRDPPNKMTAKVKGILEARGIVCSKPYVEVKQRSGSFHAYPDVICLALLEYFAFDAPTPKLFARNNYRLLAGKALYDFICTQVGYDPTQTIPSEWKQFHDRVSLTYNSVPRGYFGVFKEMADMIVTLGQAGLQIDRSFVPDISVGQSWSKHWTESGFDATYGERQKWDHSYPSYFPQAESNPQSTWCYPESALGEFRRWLREDYIEKGKFERYLTGKVQQKQLPASFAQLAIAAYNEGKER